MLVDKFNSKYSTLSESQRNLLKQYINNISNTNSFKEYIVSEVTKIQKELKDVLPKIDDNVVKIKLQEVQQQLSLIPKDTKLREKHLKQKGNK